MALRVVLASCLSANNLMWGQQQQQQQQKDSIHLNWMGVAQPVKEDEEKLQKGSGRNISFSCCVTIRIRPFSPNSLILKSIKENWLLPPPLPYGVTWIVLFTHDDAASACPVRWPPCCMTDRAASRKRVVVVAVVVRPPPSFLLLSPSHPCCVFEVVCVCLCITSSSSSSRPFGSRLYDREKKNTRKNKISPFPLACAFINSSFFLSFSRFTQTSLLRN